MAKEKAARAPQRKVARLEKKLGEAIKLRNKRGRQLGEAESSIAAIAAKIAKVQPAEPAPTATVVIAAAVQEPAGVMVEGSVTDNGATPAGPRAPRSRSRKVEPASPN